MVKMTIPTNGDLHKASGGNPSHRPANFLKTKEVKDLIAEIESSNYDATILASKNYDVENPTSKNTAVKIIRGRGKEQGTYVCKELVYRYAMWISAKFTLLVIRTFDAIATGQTLQQQFLIADKEFKTATEIASNAGYTLNYVGKKVKPVKKRIRDNLLEKGLLTVESKTSP